MTSFRRLDSVAIRLQFPALARQVAGRPAVFFDGPAGTQVPRQVIDAIRDYYEHHNANHGGLFATSLESDALLDEVHLAAADLIGVQDPDTMVFGANMTTLTFALSRALARTWQRGDEVVVTRLDHDANVTPWVLAAQDAGAIVNFVGIHREDCTLDLDDLRRKIGPRTRLVAVGCASNATGTVNPVREICQMARAVGARTFLDAVHFAPHATIDVREWECDFLACSAYKFFGPHIGILWGRRELLENLTAYKLRPAPNTLPGKWMTGTQNHECLAGVLAAINYLAELGRHAANSALTDRRAALVAAMQSIRPYEQDLASRLLAGLAELPGTTVLGITDPKRLNERLPTVSFTHRTRTPTEIATQLAEAGIFAWHGNNYALQLSETLGLEPTGMVRLGMVHYNTREEVDRVLETLRVICR